jgi:predicted membrane channel-forming protein YqfA (hemolysin III family)
VKQKAVVFHRYSLLEEIFNASTHGVGVVLGAIGLVLLIAKTLQTDSGVLLASVIVYGISIILLFAASTFYHAIPHYGAKRVLRIVDHCAIYLLIAGTYTPYTLLVIGDRLGAVIMAVVWSLAVAGHHLQDILCRAFSDDLAAHLPGYGLARSARRVRDRAQPAPDRDCIAAGRWYRLFCWHYLL